MVYTDGDSCTTCMLTVLANSKQVGLIILSLSVATEQTCSTIDGSDKHKLIIATFVTGEREFHHGSHHSLLIS